MKKEINIAVIGLGYVGLPLFCLLSKYFPCIGIDKDTGFVLLNWKDGVDYRECENQHNIKMALQLKFINFHIFRFDGMQCILCLYSNGY